MNYTIQELVQTLKSIRKEKGLSQNALADKVGIPQSHLSNIERGKVNLTLSSFMEIARTLGWDVMLIPREHRTLVRSILFSKDDKQAGSQTPAYLPDEGEDE